VELRVDIELMHNLSNLWDDNVILGEMLMADGIICDKKLSVGIPATIVGRGGVFMTKYTKTKEDRNVCHSMLRWLFDSQVQNTIHQLISS